MVGVAALVSIAALLVLIVRLGAVALRATGLADDVARFQSRSAVLGVGFTTSEAENVTTHPGRRRVVSLLMLVSSGGLLGAIASIILAFGTATTSQATERGFTAVSALLLLAAVVHLKPVDRFLTTLMQRSIRRWSEAQRSDVVTLLRFPDGNVVAELRVGAEARFDGWMLGDLDLSGEGLVTLALRRSGRLENDPPATAELEAGDGVIVYGAWRALAEIERRVTESAEHDASNAHQTG